MTRAEEAAKTYEESLDYYHCMNDWPSIAYRAGYEQAEKDTIERAIAWLEKQKGTNTEGDFARGYDCGYECCLHSHGAEWFEKQKEQKPVVTHGETYHVDTLGTQQVIAGKMPQKSAEWSEEDERMRQTAIEACKTVAEDYENSNARFYKCKDWLEYRLKSLRPVSKEFLQPHWKPSENQMSMLLAVVNDPNNAGSASCHLSLKSLYNDLKKL